MNNTGKHNLAAWVLIGILGCAPLALGAMEAVQVPLGQNLQQDARNSQGSGRPILLVFSARHCGYCELLEEEIIKPMLRSGDYEQQIIIRKVLVDSHLSLAGFNGKPQQPEDLSRHYGVAVTPTVLFVDAAGHELAERMVGINTVEMYGGYLDAAIAESRQMLADKALIRVGAWLD